MGEDFKKWSKQQFLKFGGAIAVCQYRRMYIPISNIFVYFYSICSPDQNGFQFPLDLYYLMIWDMLLRHFGHESSNLPVFNAVLFLVIE